MSTLELRALAVERVSRRGGRDMAADSTMTLKDQAATNEATAALHGAKVTKTLRLVDQSGGDILAKYGAELLAALDSGDYDMLVVPYSSRLCRSQRQGHNFLGDMADAEHELWSGCMPHTDYRTDDGYDAWSLKMFMDEKPRRERKTHSNRITDRQVHERGVSNVVNYGYRRNFTILEGGERAKVEPRRDEMSFVPDPITAPVVRRIFDMRDAGMGWQPMCDALNADGIPGPKGGAWVPTTLAGIVGNEVYLGVVKQGKRRNEKAHEPLVTRAQWRRVQTTKRRTLSGWLKTGVAGGLLLCSGCNQPLSIKGGMSNGKRFVSYGCRKYSKHGKCPRPVYIAKDIADDYVDAIMVDLLRDAELEVVVSERKLADARQAVVHATMERDAWVERSALVKPDAWQHGYDFRERKLADAQAHYEDLQADAEDADELPADEAAYLARGVESRHKSARRLIRSIRVEPSPGRGGKLDSATVQERLHVTFVDGTQASGAYWLLAA